MIRAFAKEEEDCRKYGEINRAYTQTAVTAGTIMSIFVPLITLILNMATLAILWIGGSRGASGNLEVGAIIAAINYSMQILIGFGLLTNVILTLPRGQVSAKRVYEILDTNLSIMDAPESETTDGCSSLSFEQVSFRYGGADNISQGQKQLITIARAFVADPEIILLDEATSNVDSRTEMVIQKAMWQLLKGRTSFVVAHRLSTIYHADSIVVMQNGDIAETGTHNELISKNGIYADIYNIHFSGKTA